MESPCKYYCTHCPVGKHTDPDAHRSKSQKSDQYHAQTKSAQPHDQTRRDHRKFYVSRRTKSVCRNKCQRPYNRLHKRNPGYHMETHLCTCRLHAAKNCHRPDQCKYQQAAYNDCHFCDHTLFFYVIDRLVFSVRSHTLTYNCHQPYANSDCRHSIQILQNICHCLGCNCSCT